MSEEPLVRMPELTDEQRDVVKSHGIPVDSFNPGTYWIASVDYSSVPPSDPELKAIRSYIEFTVKRIYNLTYQEKIFAKPFPAEGGHNTVIFRKGAMWLHQEDPLNGWRYRRITWDQNWSPEWPAPRLSLMEILDNIHEVVEGEISADWIKWKAEHPEVFPC